MSDYEIVDAMVVYGGLFVSRLGRAWQAGDTDNRSRLKAAFPEYWKEYAELAQRKAGKP